jgi:RNA polymerase sigma-70 factor (ECF subfamily)
MSESVPAGSLYATSVSPLQQLRQPHDKEAWARFLKLYAPLLSYWAKRAGLQEQDAADLVQDVFTTLVEWLSVFTYDRHRIFRGWLPTVLLNKWRNRRRQVAPESVDPSA